MGITVSSAEYDVCRKWIKQQLDLGHDWEWLRYFDHDPSEAEGCYYDMIDDGLFEWTDDIDYESWLSIVNKEEELQAPGIGLSAFEPNGIDNHALKNEYQPKTESTSCWSRYKSNVLSRFMNNSSLQDTELSAKWILNHLSRENGTDVVKGLVSGDVQSGKTANMAAVITQAADYRWNFFIILSGTIESLRQQTQARMIGDLKLSNSLNVDWRVIDFSGEDSDLRFDDIQLDGTLGRDCGKRYLTVCLKQKNRLTKLIKWLYSEPSRSSRLRILIIDDEADQASINTNLIEIDDDGNEVDEQNRTAINGLITNLANGRLADGSTPKHPVQALNYIAYTATPYANVLNETGNESLYPKDFIYRLVEPKSYVGIDKYFGNLQNDYLALNAVRIIPDDSIKATTKAFKDSKVYNPPSELLDSISWFLCAAAVLRSKGKRNKPISMLIHTSAYTKHHEATYKKVVALLSDASSILQRCKSIYKSEKNAFTKDDYSSVYPDYDYLDELPESLPSFKEISPEIERLLSSTQNIVINDDGDLAYGTGLHLCCDNSSAQKWAPEDAKIRIIYPDKQTIEAMDADPAFIVVGGNTLSRGLTLEGLVCSYFERNSNQADTLMQMCRWFGYPRGYETLVRIWVSNTGLAKFQALSDVNSEFKSEIDTFIQNGWTPGEFAPRIKAIPPIYKMLPSSKRKTQRARYMDIDYSGMTTEITNYTKSGVGKCGAIIKDLIKQMPGCPKKSDTALSAYYWADIDYACTIRPALIEYATYNTCEHGRITELIEWVDREAAKQNMTRWRVACAGNKLSKKSKPWTIFKDGDTEYAIGKVTRTAKAQSDDTAILKSMMSGHDALCDIPKSQLNKTPGKRPAVIRWDSGYKSQPLLLIYRIDKNSKPTSNGSQYTLGVESDIYGLAFVIPGDGSYSGKATYLQASLNL